MRYTDWINSCQSIFLFGDSNQPIYQSIYIKRNNVPCSFVPLFGCKLDDVELNVFWYMKTHTLMRALPYRDILPVVCTCSRLRWNPNTISDFDSWDEPILCVTI